MTGRIITVRHGRPALDRDVRITAKEYGDWWARYDESGLHPDERVPPRLVELARDAENVLCSTMPRAIETANQVVEGMRDVPQDIIFVEAPLPPPPVPFLKLRPGTWGVISRSFWFWGFSPGETESHPASWRRVSEIADRLIGLAEEGDVVLCAHGYLNWMIDRHMRRRRGWARIARDGGNNYWSWRVYEQPGTAPGTVRPDRDQQPAIAE